MRAIVISDIHGIKTNLSKIRNRYHELKCQKLIVLGDLYWGDYEEEYDQGSFLHLGRGSGGAAR